MDKLNVFMPCYNAERFLRDAIESILNQEYQDLKLIVVDDGSSDGSLEILYRYADEDGRVIVYENKQNRGVAYTRNRGLELCDSEYIAFMDADDVAPPYRLKRQIEFIQNHPDTDAVFGNYQFITETGEMREKIIVKERKSDDVAAALFFQNILAMGTAFIRKRIIVDNHIKFCDDYFSLEDYRFWIELMKAGAKIEILPDILQYYRIVSTGLSHRSVKNKIEERNKYFNDIHEELLDIFRVDLTERQKATYFLFTHEAYPFRKKIIYQTRIRGLIRELERQAANTGNAEAFLRQCAAFGAKLRLGSSIGRRKKIYE